MVQDRSTVPVLPRTGSLSLIRAVLVFASQAFICDAFSCGESDRAIRVDRRDRLVADASHVGRRTKRVALD
jgi:hypothetical protein